MAKQMEKFRENLEDFAAKHKEDIRKDANFRVQFQEMCASIGVDPLACEYLISLINMLLSLLLCTYCCGCVVITILLC